MGLLFDRMLPARCGPLVAALRRAARAAGARALDLLYPPFCCECDRPLDGAEPLCIDCAAKVRWIAAACPRCGLPAARPGPGPCGACWGRVLGFDRAAAAAEYVGPWRTAVLRFKFLDDHGLRDLLGKALEKTYARSFAAEPPGAIVPVPAHPLRRLLRGRDPVMELALDLGERVGIPVRPILRRARWIPSQTSLPRERRLKNPRGAYRLRTSRPPRRRGPAAPVPGSVLVLDDVLTTGATASECARALKCAGARAVMVLAAARSPDEPS